MYRSISAMIANGFLSSSIRASRLKASAPSRRQLVVRAAEGGDKEEDRPKPRTRKGPRRPRRKEDPEITLQDTLNPIELGRKSRQVRFQA